MNGRFAPLRGMMVALVLAPVLTGCDGPSPYFRGIAPVRMTVDGSTFDLRRRGRLMEGVRLNPEYAPRPGPIAARAGVAMTRISGCSVKELRGDAALVLGILDCD